MRYGPWVVASVLVLGGCDAERHVPGLTGPGDNGSASVEVLVEDDPAGAEPIASGASVPTVELRFSLELVRSGLTVTVPGSGTLTAQAALDSAIGDLVQTTDSIPAGAYGTIRLTLTQATLALAGVAPIDLLEGAPSLTITQSIFESITGGTTAQVRIDLNSDAWLVPNPAPGPGQPEFTFTGTNDFLDAITLSIP